MAWLGSQKDRQVEGTGVCRKRVFTHPEGRKKQAFLSTPTWLSLIHI